MTALAALLVVGLLTVEGSKAAFSASTANGSNTFSAGSVTITDDADGSVMFNLSNMVPGTTATKCINVTYAGTAPADVKLYGTVGGTGLATYLDTVISVGTGATGGTGFSCANFNGGVGAFNDTLANFGTSHTGYANGNGTNFAGATNNTTRSYRVQVTLQDNSLAQGKDANATFTWEAQNV
ncbi:MAG: hypothetical protein KDB24_04005 [Microthrixaceae bacterium]|nr:hypothetical protein [Microthrixaceae bacterium]